MVPAPSRRDRLTVLGGLAGVSALAWVYLLAGAGMGGMSMDGMGAMLAPKPWTGLDFALMFLMWAVMMVAMMLPSTAPAVLLYAALVRKLAPGQSAGAQTAAFVGGYLAAWSVFSLGAMLLQWGLEQLALLTPMMASASPVFGGLLLIAAGLYQWTPLKDICVKHCQAPLAFLSQHWRTGRAGALRMGFEHGIYCVGCCWAIMGLLFLGGVMNLLWIAALAGFVLLEKVAALGGRWARWATGAAAVAAGVGVIVLG